MNTKENNVLYLDNIAKSRIEDEVIEVITKSLKEFKYNPSSKYDTAAKEEINRVKKAIANYINCLPEEIIFTSGGCESNSLAIDGFLFKKFNDYDYLNDGLSHASVEKNENHLKFMIHNNDGFIDLDWLKEMCDTNYYTNGEHPFLSIVGANNETGIVQDIRAIADIIHSKDGILHVDGVQMLPTLKVDVKALDVDMMSFSGTKLGCPSGIGFLYVKKGIELKSIIHGEQENGVRGGTENVPYISGLGKAIELLEDDIYNNGIFSKLNHIRDLFINTIESNIENYEFVSPTNVYDENNKVQALPNCVNVCFKDVDADGLLLYLSLNDIYVSSGSACNSDSIEESHVLINIGIDEDNLDRCIRFSFDETFNIEDMNRVIDLINKYIANSKRGNVIEN